MVMHARSTVSVVIRAWAGYHSGMTKTNDTVRSVCPHDCPSVCALDVQRLSPERIGRIHGAAQPYTDGVVCAKVARYAERVHHPDRLMHPLRRIGAKGSGQFEPITWDDALDLIATRLQSAIAKHGPETVWPYHYAGTMGYIQRGAIRRLGHVAGWSRQRETFCVALSDAGWLAGVGVKRGVDPREMGDSQGDAGPPQVSLPPTGGGLGGARPWGRSGGEAHHFTVLEAVHAWADLLAELGVLHPRPARRNSRVPCYCSS